MKNRKAFYNNLIVLVIAFVSLCLTIFSINPAVVVNALTKQIATDNSTIVTNEKLNEVLINKPFLDFNSKYGNREYQPYTPFHNYLFEFMDSQFEYTQYGKVTNVVGCSAYVKNYYNATNPTSIGVEVLQFPDVITYQGVNYELSFIGGTRVSDSIQGNSVLMQDLKTLIMPSTLQAISFPIGESFNNASNIILTGSTIPSIISLGETNVKTIYVPDELYDVYKLAWTFVDIKKHSEITTDVLSVSEEVVVDGVTYVNKGEHYEAIKLDRTLTNAVIQEFINDVPVTKLRIIDSATEEPYNNSLKAIIIGTNIEVIEEYSFANYLELVNIIFSPNKKLKRIESFAFFNTKITNVTIPEEIEYIGKFCFFNVYNNYANFTFKTATPIIWEFEDRAYITQGYFDQFDFKINVPKNTVHIWREALTITGNSYTDVSLANKVTSGYVYSLSVVVRELEVESEENFKTITYKFCDGEPILYSQNSELNDLYLTSKGKETKYNNSNSHYVITSFDKDFPEFLLEDTTIIANYKKQYFLTFDYYTVEKYVRSYKGKTTEYEMLTHKINTINCLENETFNTDSLNVNNLRELTFNGWNKELTPATTDATYIGSYTKPQVEVRYFSSDKKLVESRNIDLSFARFSEIKSKVDTWAEVREYLRNFFMLRWGQLGEEIDAHNEAERLMKYLSEEDSETNQLLFICCQPSIEIETKKGVFGTTSNKIQSSSFRYFTGYHDTNNLIYFLDFNKVFTELIDYKMSISFGSTFDDMIGVVEDAVDTITNVANWFADKWWIFLISIAAILLLIILMPLAKAISYSTNIKAELKKQELSKVKKGNKQAKKVTAKKPVTKTTAKKAVSKTKVKSKKSGGNIN